MKHLPKILILIPLCLTGTVYGADDSALEKLADLIGEVVDEVAGNRRQPVDVVFGFDEPAEVAVEPMKADVDRRRERVAAHVAAFHDWVSRNSDLPDEAHQHLKSGIEKQIRQSEDKWKRDPQRQNQAMSDSAPIIFTTSRGAASFLSRRQLDRFLNDPAAAEHRDVLVELLDERRQAICKANLKYIVSLIDDELFLTPIQRDVLLTMLPLSIDNLETGLFAFNPQTYYLPYSSLNNWDRGVPELLLNDVQKQRLAEVRGNNGQQQYLMISSAAGVESWYKQVDDAVPAQQERLGRAAAVRIAFLAGTLNLQPEQTQYLTVAGKGAATQCIADWKKQTRNQLKEWEGHMAQQFAGQDFSFGMALPDVVQLDRNKLWLHTLEKLNADPAVQERNAFRTDAIASYLTAELDKELWLTPDQRDPLRSLVAKALPADFKAQQPYFRELECFVIPLFRIADDDVADLLTESQQQAWTKLKSQFQVNGQHVMLNTQNGGQFGFSLPP